MNKPQMEISEKLNKGSDWRSASIKKELLLKKG